MSWNFVLPVQIIPCSVSINFIAHPMNKLAIIQMLICALPFPKRTNSKETHNSGWEAKEYNKLSSNRYLHNRIRINSTSCAASFVIVCECRYALTLVKWFGLRLLRVLFFSFMYCTHTHWNTKTYRKSYYEMRIV